MKKMILAMVMIMTCLSAGNLQAQHRHYVPAPRYHHHVYHHHHHYYPHVHCHGLGSFIAGAVVGAIVENSIDAAIEARAERRAEQILKRRAERREGYYQRGRGSSYAPERDSQGRNGGQGSTYGGPQRLPQDTLREGQTPPPGQYRQPNPGQNTAGQAASADSTGFTINW